MCPFGGRMYPIVRLFCFFLIGSQFHLVSFRYDFLAFSHNFSDTRHSAWGLTVCLCLLFRLLLAPSVFLSTKNKIKNPLLEIFNLKWAKESQREVKIDTTWKNHVCYGFWIWWQLAYTRVCMCAVRIQFGVYDNTFYKHTEYIQLDVGIYCVILCVCIELLLKCDKIRFSMISFRCEYCKHFNSNSGLCPLLNYDLKARNVWLLETNKMNFFFQKKTTQSINKRNEYTMKRHAKTHSVVKMLWWSAIQMNLFSQQSSIC